jgi:DNA-binding NtrC family response regulator
MRVPTSDRVLLIDDALVVANTLLQIFLNEGYDARAVYSAEDALELLENSGWTPGLAVIDVQLPRMNGIDLAIILKAKYPGLRLCLLSGHASTTYNMEDARQRGHLFEVLAKPVHPTILLDLALRLQSG